MLVILESPFAGQVTRNIIYARRAMLDSIHRRESPIAFHLLYPQVLRDADVFERELGFRASFKWHKHADLMAVYQDYGISGGMQLAIDSFIGRIEYRNIGQNAYHPDSIVNPDLDPIS